MVVVRSIRDAVDKHFASVHYIKNMIKRKRIFGVFAPYCIALERSVGAVVFRVVQGKIEFLLLQYRNGHWEFPRGKMEEGEEEQDTMRREIYEETGIKNITVIEGFRRTMSFAYRACGQEKKERIKDQACIFVRKKAIFYLAESHDSTVTVSCEHRAAEWLSFGDAKERLTYKNGKKVLTHAQKYLNTAIIKQ